MLAFHRFDPSACGFPPPRVPSLPHVPPISPVSALSALSALSHPFGSGLRSTSGASFRSGRSYARARYALTDAYQLCGVGAHGALLAPSYHCRTMIDPAVALGAEVGLYRLDADLNPDIDALGAAVAACTQPVKALLATHYFGLARPLQRVQEFCRAHGIALIEDCAHAFVQDRAAHGAEPAPSIGSWGRYGVSSFYKFCPSADGGMLWANGGAPMPARRAGGSAARRELRGLWSGLGSSLSPRAAVQSLEMSSLGAEIDSLRARLPTLDKGRHWVESPAGVSHHYDPAEQARASLAVSRWVMRHTDVDRLAARRRANHRQWAAAVAGVAGCRALYPTLADGCVPYMFALYIDHPNVHFFAMKHLGIPIWRWDEMAVSPCAVANANRLNLLHLPCHQELSPAQMEWMIAAVTGVLRHIPAEPH